MNILRALVGLGNPGKQYIHHRHSIGFHLVDTIAKTQGLVWQDKGDLLVAEWNRAGNTVYLVKPYTGMNNSGVCWPFLRKKGIVPDQIMVIHDELEIASYRVTLKYDGSARGHNGLRSIIEQCGPRFYRLRFGIGRPPRGETVATYVLTDFTDKALLEQATQQAVSLIEKALAEGLSQL